jgi:hypothetical protein
VIRFRSVVILTAVLGIGEYACGGGGGPPLPTSERPAAHAFSSATQLRYFGLPGAPPKHLYLTGNVEGAVYSFPLSSKGIPARTPDAVITGLNYPRGVAVDAAGYLYVSLEGRTTGEIDVFAPGATGHPTPVRVIVTPGEPPADLLLARGYLFVDFGYVAVYSASGSGTVTPLEKIYPGHSNAVSMAIDPNGAFYLSQENSVIAVYPDVFPPQTSSSLILPSREIRPFVPSNSYWYGLAVDRTDIFVRMLTTGPYMKVAVLPANSNGPTKPRRVMVTTGCQSSGSSGGLSFDLLRYSDLLYQACETPVGVFIYRSSGAGKVRPLFGLRGPFQTADQIALGP